MAASWLSGTVTQQLISSLSDSSTCHASVNCAYFHESILGQKLLNYYWCFRVDHGFQVLLLGVVVIPIGSQAALWVHIIPPKVSICHFPSELARLMFMVRL